MFHRRLRRARQDGELVLRLSSESVGNAAVPLDGFT